MLNSEQTEKIKKQLIQQIEKSFPEDRKDFAKKQIQDMNSEQLEEFLIKNKMIKSEEVQHPGSGQGCVFCSILAGNIDSYKIDDNKKAIAVLEINPVSKGHAIIIPKTHLSSSEKVPQSVFSLAKSVAKKIKSNLKPKSISISLSNLFGHEVINVIPIYGDKNLEERHPAKPEELLELQQILIQTKKSLPKKPRKIKPKKSEKIWLPKRIP